MAIAGGARAHLVRHVTYYLNHQYDNCWIDRGSPQAWPWRSSELNPYCLNSHSRDELMNRITQAADNIREIVGTKAALRGHRCEVQDSDPELRTTFRNPIKCSYSLVNISWGILCMKAYTVCYGNSNELAIMFNNPWLCTITPSCDYIIIRLFT